MKVPGRPPPRAGSVWLCILLLAAACAPASAAMPGATASSEHGATATVVMPVEGTAAATASAPAGEQNPTASAAPTAAPSGEPIFTVAVINDTQTQNVSREQALALVNEAGLHLKALVPVIMVMTDYVEDGGGGATTEMLQRYMIAHPTALPNGVVILSHGDGDQARLKGGYGYTAPAPAGFRNSFVSPLAGPNQVYVAVVDYSFRYMECGYGGADRVKSSSALGGECDNHPGVACVEQNGYSMCSSAVGRLYMSTPTYFGASAIVHGLLQGFAPGGTQDDYSTPECTARMGYPAGFRDLQESQYHNDLCPFVYDNLLKSYQP